MEFTKVMKELPLAPPKRATSAAAWQERTSIVRHIVRTIQQEEENWVPGQTIILRDPENTVFPPELNLELFDKHRNFLKSVFESRNWLLSRNETGLILIVRREPHPDTKLVVPYL